MVAGVRSPIRYGWTGFLRDDFAVGVMTLWGQAPPEARSVVIRWLEETAARDVTCGHYLFVRWDVPEELWNDVPERVRVRARIPAGRI